MFLCIIEQFFLPVICIKKEEPGSENHYQRPESKGMPELKHIHHQSGGKRASESIMKKTDQGRLA